jgi:hypothetical protein
MHASEEGAAAPLCDRSIVFLVCKFVLENFSLTIDRLAEVKLRPESDCARANKQARAVCVQITQPDTRRFNEQLNSSVCTLRASEGCASGWIAGLQRQKWLPSAEEQANYKLCAYALCAPINWLCLHLTDDK